MGGHHGGSVDPRLVWAVWADESAKAGGSDEAAGARHHREQDRVAAEQRAAAQRPGGILGRVARFSRLARR